MNRRPPRLTKKLLKTIRDAVRLNTVSRESLCLAFRITPAQLKRIVLGEDISR